MDTTLSTPQGAARPRAAMVSKPAIWLWPMAAVGASLIVQLVFVRASWFYLDDVRNLAQARQQGLSWSFLTAPIGQHLTPGHRLLDWLIAVPFGRQWFGAVVLTLAFSAVMLIYLAGSLTLAFGARRDNAIPVLLAGTAWPLLGTAQWFAGSALAIPAGAAIAGALYHHLSWRLRGRRSDRAAVLAWTVVGLLFSEQAILIPPLLVVCGLVASDERLNWRSVISNVVPVLPLVIPVLALGLYVSSQPWATTISVPSVTNFIDLVRVVVVRALLPALAGVGMDGAPPDPLREELMRALAAIGVGGVLLSAIWLRHRWLAALALAGCGAVLTSMPISLARLDIGVSIAGSEPRYLLPAVLMGALAVGALLARQSGRPPRRLPPPVAALTAVIGLVWGVLYVSNLSYTYATRRVALDFGHASQQLTAALGRSLRAAGAAGRTGAIVDGPLPFPLFYAQPGAALRSAYGRFFIRRGIAAPGVPDHRGLLSIADDGSLQSVRFHPSGNGVRCTNHDSCAIPFNGPVHGAELALEIQLTAPARPGDWMHYHVNGPPDASPDRTLIIPPGASRLVVPAQLVNPRSVVATFLTRGIELRSVRAGGLQP